MADVESILTDNGLAMYDCAACKIKHVDNGKHAAVTLPCCCGTVCKSSFVDHLDDTAYLFKSSIPCNLCKHKLPKYMVVNGKETRYFTRYQTMAMNILLEALGFSFFLVLLFPTVFFAVGVFVLLNLFGICVGTVSTGHYCFTWFHYHLPTLLGSDQLVVSSTPFIALFGVCCFILLLAFSWVMFHKLGDQFFKIRRFSIRTMRAKLGFYYSSLLL